MDLQIIVQNPTNRQRLKHHISSGQFVGYSDLTNFGSVDPGSNKKIKNNITLWVPEPKYAGSKYRTN